MRKRVEESGGKDGEGGREAGWKKVRLRHEGRGVSSNEN